MAGLSALALGALGSSWVAGLWSRAAGNAAIQSTYVDIDSLSDEELMKGTQFSATLPNYALPCPVSCDSGSPSEWSIYSSLDRLASCNQSVLFDFSIYTPIESETAATKLRVCTTTTPSPTNESSLLTGSEKQASTATLQLAHSGST